MLHRHILIADDDRHLRESLCEVLTDIGWDATPVGCGQEAIRRLERGQFDLLLSDVDMPDMTGFELLAWAHRHLGPERSTLQTPGGMARADFKTVLMSARADQFLSAAAVSAGAVTLLPKPVRVSELSALMHTMYPT